MALVAGEVISFVTFLVGQALISGKAPSATLGQPDVLRAVIGAGLYLAVLALLGTALGVMLRHAAGAIGSIVAILLVLPGIADALPTSWSQPIEKWWPTNAGTAGGHHQPGQPHLGGVDGLRGHGRLRGGRAGRRLLLLERRDA